MQKLLYEVTEIVPELVAVIYAEEVVLPSAKTPIELHYKYEVVPLALAVKFVELHSKTPLENT